MKVLYINANPKTTNSVTNKMADHFLDTYKAAHPGDEVTTLNLYKEDLGFITEQDLNAMFTGTDTKMHRYAHQFAEADRYIINAPFWNLSFPAILKAYIDHIVISGVTFGYTENGAVGFLTGKGKKAVYLAARGGQYTEGPMVDFEYGEKYIRGILGFMGVTDFTAVLCECTSVLQGEALDQAVNKAIDEAAAVAKAL